MGSPAKCVVLVPHLNVIDVETHEALHALALRGYEIRRIVGLSPDAARSVLATKALDDGFAELLWIDSDVVFRPEDVERLRDHHLPICCGVYPKKGPTEFACSFLPGTAQIPFGKQGVLTEIEYAGFGFILTRREVFERIQLESSLPRCGQRSGSPMIPFFLPMVIEEKTDHRYLAEDYAFCERARRCGFKIMADTTIRLIHAGRYGYSWDDIAKKMPKS
jgi:hypothetical protein